ncbi:hypothetical protein J7K28_08815 [Candidatus Aerophobetes bacterium]|nr:hypothetical protein [Candidatus Aerophobetes bacterium]
MALNENIIQKLIQEVLDTVARNEFECSVRKNNSSSVIKKPVDLHIIHKATKKVIIYIEVTDVNSTQLVNEACRLYFDTCFRKILIIGTENAPKNSYELCVEIFKRLYGQNKIDDTPVRILIYDLNNNTEFKSKLKEILKEFLVRY